MRRRFFVDGFDDRVAVVRGDTAHHLSRVLRVTPGQLYELSDGGAVWLARVERVNRDAVEFFLVEQITVREPALRLRLLLAVVKFDRFEWCLEKATELGAWEIVPLAAARSEKKLIAAAARRAARWKKIVRESAQQSRRLRPPHLADVSRPGEAFTERGQEENLRILLSERPGAPKLQSVVAHSAASGRAVPPVVTVAIGPEGGWTDEEVGAGVAAGFVAASLGPLILRTETAVIAALANLNYALGE